MPLSPRPDILVVDDSAPVRGMLKAALAQSERRSATVLEAASAEEARELFRANEVDLVFLSLNLPGGDSLRLMNELHAQRPEARIVLVTATAEDDPQVRQAFSDGAYAYVPKPVQTPTVLKVLERIGTDEGRLRRIG